MRIDDALPFRRLLERAPHRRERNTLRPQRAALGITVRDAEPNPAPDTGVTERSGGFSLPAAEHADAGGGKTEHYLLRWLSTRGEAGPWSETAGATIGA